MDILDLWPRLRRDWRGPVAALAGAVLVLVFAAPGLGFLLAVLLAGALAMGRDPVRAAPDSPAAVLAPVDGRVTAVERAAPPASMGFGEDARLCVTVARGPLDSAALRQPADGSVRRAGEFGCIISNEGQADVGLLLAPAQWSMLTRLRTGRVGAAGDSLGAMGPLGQVKVYLEPGVEIAVRRGQTVIAGETALTR
ncbi:MAG: hypothetical protein TEF_07510 [Rhizobiales bacterium NRL2]|jgi:phosphatidylserine decarboxylase|nr:MAG: hypothetical protein TEF_07510 [Rhizobiales bacterium NRL2]